MKKVLSILILLFLFVPSFVLAEEKNIVIKSVEFIEKSDNVVESNPAKVEDETLKFDLKFLDVGDYAKYKLVVMNNTNLDLLFDETNLKPEDKSIGYELEYEDSKLIKAGTESTVYLKVLYSHKAASTLFRNSVYDASEEARLNLSDNFISIPNTLRNIGIIPLMIMLFTIGAIIYGIKLGYQNKKITSMHILSIVLLMVIIPKTVDALKLYEIPVSSRVIIEKVKPKPCTFEGNLVQGAQFIEGQYTYRYKQQFNGSSWDNITEDGWGITLTDKTSTEPVTSNICSTINDKPIVSMAYAFAGSQASSINLDTVDTSNVLYMNYMFAGVKITDIDLSSFNTSNVKRMDYMFCSAASLTELYLRHFDVSNVTSFSYMFSGSNSLKKLNLDDWDFRSTDMYFLDLSITNLEELSARNWKNMRQLNNWGTGTSLSSTKIQYLDVTGWDVSGYTNLYNGFYSLKTVKKIKGLETWDVSNITDMANLFENCESLEEIDVSTWNTSNVKYMSYMFSYTYKLKKLDVSSFDTSNVINIYNMFYSAKALNTLDLSNFDFSSTTNLSSMFGYCLNLRSVTLPNVDYSHITSVSNMFENTYMIRTLDLSMMDLSGVQSGSYMLNNTYGLIELKTPINVSFDVTIVKKLYDEDDAEYSSIPKNTTESITLTAHREAVFKPGSTFNSDIKDVCGDSQNPFKHFKRSDELPDYIEYRYNDSDNVASATNSEYPIYMWLDREDDMTVYFYSEIEKLYLNPNAYSMFSYIRSVEDIETKDMDSSRAYTLSYFVKECNNLKTLDISHFDTSNVEDFYGAFKYTYALTEFDVSHFDTSKVWKFSEMFTRSSITSLDLSSWDMSNAQYTSSMITDMTSLQVLITPKKMNNVSIQLPTTMADDDGNTYTTITQDMPPNLRLRTMITVNLSVDYDAQISTRRLVYDPVEDTVYGDLPVPTMEGKTFAGWYTDSAVGTLITPNTPLPKKNSVTIYAAWVTPGAAMVSGSLMNTKMKKLSSGLTDYFSNDSNIYYIKRETNSSKLPDDLTIDNIISKNGSEHPIYIWYKDHTIYYYTEAQKLHVDYAGYMFYGLKELKEINLDNFDFSDTGSFYDMFVYDEKLKIIDFSNTDLSNASDMDNMFEYCTSLETVIFGEQNTTRLTSIERMFMHAEKLTSVDIGNLNTYNVTNMQYLFGYAKSLKNLDLTNFETESAIYMSDMFSGCESIERLDFSNHPVTQATSIDSMFSGCKNLVYLNLSSFDIVAQYHYYFCSGCSKLEELDLSGIDFNSYDSYIWNDNGKLSGMTSLKRLKTPKWIRYKVEIPLPKPMYFKGSSEPISKLDHDTYTRSWLELEPWD